MVFFKLFFPQFGCKINLTEKSLNLPRSLSALTIKSSSIQQQQKITLNFKKTVAETFKFSFRKFSFFDSMTNDEIINYQVYF
jgi:hypothetical protein